MRSCIYCGKELQKGEKCTCVQSRAHSNASQKTQNSANQGQKNENTYTHTSQYNDPNRTQYQTGYTQKDGFFKRTYEKAKAKRTIRKSRKQNKKHLFRIQLDSFLNVLRDPVAAVQNPKNSSMGSMITLWAIFGAVLWLCAYFIMSNVPRGPLSMLANIMSFNGMAGYKVIGYMLMMMLSGAVSGTILFFLYTGVFYAIGRFLFRDRDSSYQSVCQRLAFTSVPFCAICVIGALVSSFSATTLLILLICGAFASVILTYEALRTQWSYLNQGRVVYGLMFGLFILSAIICYILRLS